MTEIKSSTNPRGAGRKPLPADEKRVKKTVSVAPEVADELARGRPLSKGLEMMARGVLVFVWADNGQLIGTVQRRGTQYEAWTRKRIPGRPGYSHGLLGSFDDLNKAVSTVKARS